MRKDGELAERDAEAAALAFKGCGSPGEARERRPAAVDAGLVVSFVELGREVRAGPRSPAEAGR